MLYIAPPVLCNARWSNILLWSKEIVVKDAKAFCEVQESLTGEAPKYPWRVIAKSGEKQRRYSNVSLMPCTLSIITASLLLTIIAWLSTNTYISLHSFLLYIKILDQRSISLFTDGSNFDSSVSCEAYLTWARGFPITTASFKLN